MANIVVTTTADSGAGSLREAIGLINSGASTADTIVFDAGLNLSTITLASTLSVTRSMKIDGDIDGDGSADIIISGNNAVRIFSATGALTSLALNGLILEDGSTSFSGGAVSASAIDKLTITNSILVGNQAAANGGAIFATSTDLTIASTLLSGNTASYGAAVFANNGQSQIINTTVFSNNASPGDAAIKFGSSATATIHSSTIAHNSGGILVENASGATLDVFNTVVSDNGAAAPFSDVTGTIANAGASLFSSSVTITNDAGGNILNSTGANLDTILTLAPNGTAYLGYGPGSLLENAGNAAFLPTDANDLDGDGNTTEPLPTDGIGYNRTADGLDIGAVQSRSVVTVDTISDLDDDDFSAGNLSLREALRLVDSGGTIRFDASIAGQTITLAGSSFNLGRSVNIDGDIDGDERADITLSGNNASRIFEIGTPDVDLRLDSLTLADGFGSSSGGAILITAPATNSSLTVFGTTFVDNTSQANGGAVYSQKGDVTIEKSLFLNNHGGGLGGAVLAFNGASLAVEQTTFEGNTSNNGGGAIYWDIGGGSDLNLLSNTFIGNVGDLDGSSTDSGGALNISATTGNRSLINNVFFDNKSGSALTPDTITGAISFDRSNFSDVVETQFAHISNIVGSDPGLGVLQDNGGPVDTRNPVDGSVLIDAGSGPYPDTTDANGNARTVGSQIDIGATEYQPIVTTAQDELVDGDLATDSLDGDGLSLREAIYHSGGKTVTFDASLAGQTITITLDRISTTTLRVDGDIDGDGIADITVDGGGVFGIFGASQIASISNINLQNGSAASGGAFIKTSTLGNNFFTFDNVTFTNNVATGGTGGSIAIDTASDDLTITNSRFIGGTASGAGSAVWMDSDSGGLLEIADTSFSGSVAPVDGVVSIVGSSGATFDHVTFDGNTGQAIYMFNTGGRLNIKGSTFVGNDAGAAVLIQYFSGNSPSGGLVVSDTRIEGNTGQALEAATVGAVIANTLFAGNDSGSNELIELEGRGIGQRDFFVVNSTFSGNGSTAVERSGDTAVLRGRTLDLEIYNSTFTGNTSTYDSSQYGVIKLNASGSFVSNLDFFNSVVAGNSRNGVQDDAVLAFGGPGSFVTSATSSFFGTGFTPDNDNGGNTFSGGDPMLGELLFNDGVMRTHAPLDGSPLIDAGNNLELARDAYDLDGDGSLVDDIDWDARFLPRINGTVDIGAVESIIDETIEGTDADNMIFGGSGTDILRGMAGADDLDGGSGIDQMEGGTGNDEYWIDTADDVVTEVAGQGYDRVYADGVANYILPDHVERLTFLDTFDHIASGNAGNNRFDGNAGNDRFVLDAGGNDTFSGGQGQDTFDARFGSVGINIDLVSGTHGGDAAGDLFASIEVFWGSNNAAVSDTMVTGAARAKFYGFAGDDDLTGGATVDYLDGGQGDDTLNGMGARDGLRGFTGDDTLTGGAGRDYFQYVFAGFDHDTITDYQDGLDYLRVFSAVADEVSDFTITGNGTSTVVLTLNDGTGDNSITINGAGGANVTIDAADFLFY